MCGLTRGTYHVDQDGSMRPTSGALERVLNAAPIDVDMQKLTLAPAQMEGESYLGGGSAGDPCCPRRPGLEGTE